MSCFSPFEETKREREKKKELSSYLSSSGDIVFRRHQSHDITLISHVVTALQPCDRALMQYDKLKIEQYAWKWKESVVYYNTAIFYCKDLLGI